MTMPRHIQEGVEKEAAEEAAELARIAELEKQEQAEQNPPADPPAIEATPAETPAATEPPPQPEKQDAEQVTVNAELERLRAENAQLEQRWRTAQGMLSKRDGDMAETMKAMRAELDALKARPTEPPKPTVPAHLRHLTPEQRKAISEDSDLPLEVQMAKGIVEDSTERLRGELDKTLDAKLAEIRQKAEAEQKRLVAEAQWESHKKRVLTKVEELSPGFSAEDNDPASKWHTFLALPDPESLTGETYGERALRDLQSGYAKGIAQLRAEYKALNPGGSGVKSLEGQVKPDVSRATDKPRTVAAKPAHTVSEYEAFWENKRRGTLKAADGKPMTREQINAYEAELDDWYAQYQMTG